MTFSPLQLLHTWAVLKLDIVSEDVFREGLNTLDQVFTVFLVILYLLESVNTSVGVHRYAREQACLC